MKDKYSSKAQAENGIDNTTIMTPLRVKQSILVNSPAAPQASQSDWNESDSTKPSYIKNKPVVPSKTSQLTNDSNFISDASYVHTDNNYTTTEKTKLSGIEDGAEVNVQSDWSQADTTADDYIKNKPTIPTNTSDLVNDGPDKSTSYKYAVVNARPTGIGSGPNGINVSRPTGYNRPIIKPIINGSTLDKPLAYEEDIPTVNDATLTIQKNSTTVGTFTANSSTATTVDITVPTKVSDLQNDSGFLTTETDPVYSSSAAASITSSDITSWNAAEPNVIEVVKVDGTALTVTNKAVDITGKQDTLVSGTNIKTVNNQSLLGSGNITIGGGGGSSTDVQINGTSITSNDVANIITKSAYDQYSNRIVTEDDVKYYNFSEASLLNMTSTSSTTFQRLAEAVCKRSRIFIYTTNLLSSYFKHSAVIRLLTDGLDGGTPSFNHTVMYYFDVDNNYAEMDITVSGTTVTVTKTIIPMTEYNYFLNIGQITSSEYDTVDVPIMYDYDSTNENGYFGYDGYGGYKYGYKTGSTTSTGYSEIYLGNDKSSTTNGNSKGGISLYTSGTGRNYIAAGSHNNNYINTLPDKGGIFAMTSDIPTVNNGTLTIKRNGTQIATFSANQSGNATADISVPTLPTVSTGTLSITKTSGNSTATGTFAKYGNVVSYDFNISTTGTVASGANVFVGNITNHTPTKNAILVGYSGARAIIGSYTTAQVITVRNAGATTISSGTDINIRGTFIVN